MAKHVFLAAEGELPANNAGSAVVGPAPVQPPYAHLHPQVELVTPPTPDRLLPGQPLIPPLVEEQAGYRLRFARTEADLEEVQRLRFRVFNLELNEGLAESYQTGRDEDAFDPQCQHLMVEHAPSGACVGTYRLQVAESALGADKRLQLPRELGRTPPRWRNPLLERVHWLLCQFPLLLLCPRGPEIQPMDRSP